jgi:alkanesulfonate monooxygenase SsuD/methylene tetrahydromethanopterin reductase-like flavin-dependent oxidoreductase (luciferase family)
VNGAPAPPPIVAGWTFCDPSADRAEEMARRYIGEYWRSVVRHYELVGDHLQKMRGYEGYRSMQERATRPGGVDELVDFFLGLQVWGTPEQCYEKVVANQRRLGGEAFVGVFSYAGMPWETAEASMRLFAREVMPELKRHVPVERQRIARAGVGAGADADAFRLPA